MREKQHLLTEVLRLLEDEHQKLVQAAETTRKGAVHEEARPENDKDTRALEASYLARGQAKRVEELVESIGRLRFVDLKPSATVRAGSLIRVENEDESEELYFLLPSGGGLKIETRSGETVRVITGAAPIGQSLQGCSPDDEVELRVGKKTRLMWVVEIT